MNIIVDENIPRSTVDALRAMGHTVIDVRGTQAEGSSDDTLWRTAQEAQAILITTDKGFVHRRDEANWGILVVRLRQPNRQKIHAKVLHALAEYADWRNLTIVMQDTVMRIH